jgi:hypothetical protein
MLTVEATVPVNVSMGIIHWRRQRSGPWNDGMVKPGRKEVGRMQLVSSAC